MSQATMRPTSVFQIVGMSFSSCTKTLARRLQDLDGVAEVGINYKTDKAYINYDHTTVSPETIRETIEKVGYKALEKQARMAV